MRKLWKNNHADMNMILTAIVLAIVFAIGLIVVWNVMGSLDNSTVDENIRTNVYNEGGTTYKNGTTYAANATDDLQDNLETFFTVGPIVLIVVAAVGILSYVMLLRRG